MRTYSNWIDRIHGVQGLDDTSDSLDDLDLLVWLTLVSQLANRCTPDEEKTHAEVTNLPVQFRECANMVNELLSAHVTQCFQRVGC